LPIGFPFKSALVWTTEPAHCVGNPAVGFLDEFQDAQNTNLSLEREALC
jgi:hypothetical protein